MTDMEKKLSQFLEKNYCKDPEKTFRGYVLDHMEKLLSSNVFSKEATVYQRGNIDRKTYYSLKRGDDSYRPCKTTALAYCIALGLSVKEAEELIWLSGYHFEENNLTDQIVIFCLKNKIYSADVVNSFVWSFANIYKCPKCEYIGSNRKEWRSSVYE